MAYTNSAVGIGLAGQKRQSVVSALRKNKPTQGINSGYPTISATVSGPNPDRGYQPPSKPGIPPPYGPGTPPYLPPGGKFPQPQPSPIHTQPSPISPQLPFDPGPWTPSPKPIPTPTRPIPGLPISPDSLFPGNPTPPPTTVPPNSVLAPIFAIPPKLRTPMEAQIAKEYEDYVAKRDLLAKGSPERAAHDYSYMSAAARARQAVNLEIAKKERALHPWPGPRPPMLPGGRPTPFPIPPQNY